MHRPFAKYVGCGNDFIFFDHRDPFFPSENKTLIQNLCHRQKGIGADGIVLLENSVQADYKMRIFNADGSEAEMCGNGIRCLMRFLEHLGLSNSSYKIEVANRILHLTHQGSHINVNMGEPTDLRWNILIEYKHINYRVHYLNTGVPHVVLFVDHIDEINLAELGPYLRYHKAFAPQGTNVNIAECLPNQILKIRTYERGVEGETLACGTGATAVALAAHYQYQYSSPIRIETRLGEFLTISFQSDENNFSHVLMAGPASRTFQGTISL